MEWAQTLTIVGTNFVILGSTVTLFLWARSEANQDRRAADARLDAALKAISDEMRDFHGRLISIEERNKKQIF